MNDSTILHRLNNWAEEEPACAMHRFKDANGEWQSLSTSEIRDRVFHLALFLESKGMKNGEIGVIHSYNRTEWICSELSMQLIGAQAAGLYPNASLKDAQYIIDHTEAKILCVQNKDYYDRATGNGKEALPDRINLIIVYEGPTDFAENTISYADALAEGKKLAQGKTFQQYLDKVDPKAGSFLIYTSGTTGRPKGAVLSHDNLAYTSVLATKHWGMEPVQDGHMFSFLPLCHIAEKIQSVGVGITLRYTINFASSFDNVSKELVEVQPTVLLCVPRLWEKMVEGVEAKIKNGKGLKKKMAVWALGVGRRVSEAKYSGRSASFSDLLQLQLAHKLVISKVQHAMGLSRVTKAASGAAPLNANVTKWFRAIGIEINECFGQTESTGVICLTEPEKDCAGTVGFFPAGTEGKIAEDGEVLSKGRHIFLGYFKNDEATRATIKDGWLHTGDLAKIADNGQVRIVGRKKEIMKTSGGKMIAPVPIEEQLKESPLISQVCIVGDGEKYFTALITLSEDMLKDVSKMNGSGSKDGVVIAESLLADIQKVIDNVNAELAGYEQVKYFKVLNREFSIEDGEMTPTMKMKRAVISEHFKDIIGSMYN